VYRISVTTIEKFHRFITDASPFDTEASLLESIKGIFLGNDKTRVGSCYHKIIEQEAHIVDGGLVAEADGVQIFFSDQQALPAVEFKRRHYHMIHEVPATKICDTKIGPVLLSARIDGLEGLHVQDTKTKFRPVDLVQYADSYQWRYYLDMLGLDTFYYDVFEVCGFEALSGGQPFTLPGVIFRDPVRLECLRYPHMGDDCRLMLQEFLEYIQDRNLWQFLKVVPEATAC
jgi:hypothetical protein